MINSYTKFSATILLLQVSTILFSGIVILRHFPPIHMINAVIALLIAILLLRVKWRWTPIFGILYGLLFSILTVPSLIISMKRNIDPEYNAMLEASNPFIGISFLSALFVLAIFITSLAGLITNLRPNHQPHTWFTVIKRVFYGATAMGILISFYLQFHWITGINAESVGKLPIIVMKSNSVEPSAMTIESGDQPIVLHIRNESENNCHILSFPDLNTSVHMERGRSGLIVIDPKPGTMNMGVNSTMTIMMIVLKGF